MSNKRKKIRVIDETLREGMQFHGLVFSLEQRIKILEFQEMLGVDVCQAGYPPALDQEADIVRALAGHARKNGFNIRTAALGRALARDAETIINTEVDDPHFHFHITKDASQSQRQSALDDLAHLFNKLNVQHPGAEISLAMLDMGRTPPPVLEDCLKAFDGPGDLSILSLPDTSGIMAPNQVTTCVAPLADLKKRLQLSIHCHNDMGMATANTLTGIQAGAEIFEASALGIGERNGLADIYITAKLLSAQGYDIGLDLNNIEGFKAYYTYVDKIVREQTGIPLMTYQYPVFGTAVKTHVAGTHAGGQFGTTTEEKFFLNPLCGRGLVKKYLDTHAIPFDTHCLDAITREIKNQSMNQGRSLSKKEITGIATKNHLQNPL